MQRLKEDIRIAILDSAKEEIKQKTFAKASMRDIAQNAGITVGNVYRYFENKEAILEALLTPLLEEIAQLIFEPYNEENWDFSIEAAIFALTKLYQKRTDELLLLFRSCEGSQYENERMQLEALIQLRVEKEMEKKKGKEDAFMSPLLAHLLVEGIGKIMEACEGDEKRFSALSQRLLKILTRDIVGLGTVERWRE